MSKTPEEMQAELDAEAARVAQEREDREKAAKAEETALHEKRLQAMRDRGEPVWQDGVATARELVEKHGQSKAQAGNWLFRNYPGQWPTVEAAVATLG